MSLAAVEKPPLAGPDGRPLPKVNVGFDEEQAVKDFIFTSLGDLSDITFLFNEVLVAKYIREKVSDSLVASHETELLDRFEGVVGLVLKIGPTAFQDDSRTRFPWEAWIGGGLVEKEGQVPIRVGDWVMYRASDGWDKNVQIRGSYTTVRCRVLQDAHLRARVKFPGRWF